MESGEEPSKKLQAKMEEASQAYMELYNSREEFQETQSTGFVWLLIRKPTLAAVSTEVSKSERP